MLNFNENSMNKGIFCSYIKIVLTVSNAELFCRLREIYNRHQVRTIAVNKTRSSPAEWLKTKYFVPTGRNELLAAISGDICSDQVS